MTALRRWYRGLSGRERALATTFVTVIVGTLPCYAFGLALLLAPAAATGAAAPEGAGQAAPTPPTTSTPVPTTASTPVPSPQAAPTSAATPLSAATPVPARAAPVAPSGGPHRKPESPGHGPRGNARGHDR